MRDRGRCRVSDSGGFCNLTQFSDVFVNLVFAFIDYINRFTEPELRA